MTMKWSVSYNSFVKFHGKKILGATKWLCYIQVCVIIRCVIKGLHCIKCPNILGYYGNNVALFVSSLEKEV